MDFIAEQLNMASLASSLRLVSKRRIVMKEQWQNLPPTMAASTNSVVATITAIASASTVFTYESFDFDNNNSKHGSKHNSIDDDETASTVSTSDDSFSHNSGSSVSFADELVTQVYVRPMTTLKEKRDLFYNERDFRRFRQEYFIERESSLRPRLVHFADQEASDVYVYANPAAATSKAELYYSNQDLQRFLDEFLVSLDSSAAC